MKSAICICVISLSFVIATIHAATTKEPCGTIGGRCRSEDKCSPELVAPMGICQNEGTVCCVGLPKNYRSCEERGGMCMARDICHGPKIKAELSDCKNNEDCCVLI